MKFNVFYTLSPLIFLIAALFGTSDSMTTEKDDLQESITRSMITPVAISSVCVAPDCSEAEIGLTGLTGLPCPCVPGLTDDIQVTIAFPLIAGGTTNIVETVVSNCESTVTFDVALPAGVDCNGDIQIINILQDPDNSDGLGSCPQTVPFSTLFVSIATNPVASANGPYGPFCLDDPDISLHGSPAPNGAQTGFWTGPGVTDASVLDSFANFDPETAGVGVHMVVYQFTDATGCMGTDTAMIEVFDSPLANAGDDGDLCQNETLTMNSAAAGGVLPYTINWTATSGSFDDPTILRPDYTAGASGPDTLVLSVVDFNGCTSTDTIVLNIIEAPSIDPGGDTSVCSNSDLQLFSNATGGAAPYLYSWQATGGSFNDPSLADPTYTNSVPGSYDITLSVIDQNGCLADSTFEVIVRESAQVDLGGNQILCANADLNIDADVTGGQMPYSYAWTANGGSFSDPNVEDPTYFNDVPGAYVLTLTVTENAGCETVESIVVTVLDSIRLDMADRFNVCENSATTLPVDIDGGTPPYTYFWTSTGGSFTDQTVEDAEFISGATGLNLVTLRVTDAFGCEALQSSIVEVGPDFALDAGPDAAMCSNAPFTLTPQVSGGTAPFSYVWTASAGSFADASAQNAEYSNSTPGNYEIYLEVIDSFGCSQMDTIVMNVNTPPVVDAGLDRTICNEEPIVLSPTIVAPNGPATYLWTADGGGFSDATVPNPNYSSLTPGIYTLRLTVTDAFGCQSSDSLEVLVNQEPFFQNCPDTLVFGNDEDQCSAFANWQAPIGLDHCNLNVTVEQTFGPSPGTRLEIDSFYRVEYTVTAQNDTSQSTCSFYVVVHDTECPEFITNLPQDMTLTCDDVPEPFVVIPEWHTRDNCTDAADIQVTFREDTTDMVCAKSYVLKRYWTATDLAGNSCDYVQKITVDDTIAPSFTAPADDTVSCQDLATLDTSVLNMSDNCTPDSLLVVSFVDITDQDSATNSCAYYNYNIERVYTLSDECGNTATQSQFLTVTDEVIPVANCSDVTIYLDESGMAVADVNDFNNGSFDACAPDSVLSLRLSRDTFSCADYGPTEVILYVEDPCGNEAACVSTVTVMDTFAPSIICPADRTITLNPGECEEIFNFGPTIADNCPTSWVSEPANGSALPIGTHTITITAQDSFGNSAECSFEVVIEEYPTPITTMSCNNQVNISLNEDCEASLTVDQVLEGGPYGCYDDFILYVIDPITGDTLHDLPHFTIEDIDRTFTVSVYNPETGNSCWGNVLVEQKLEPEVICPADTVIACNQSLSPDDLGRPLVVSCEPEVAIVYEDEVMDNGACSDPRREIFRTWTITDESGNEVVCVQRIEIAQFDLNQVEFPADFTRPLGTALSCTDVGADSSLIDPAFTGLPSIMGNTLDPDEQTLCDFTLSYWDKRLEGCGNSFSILRHWQVINVCDEIEAGVNPIEHKQLIHVVDDEAPVVTYPEDITLSTSSSSCVSSWTIPDPVVSDCSPFDYHVTTDNGEIIDLNPGFILVGLDEEGAILEYAIEDHCGNITSHEIEITVIDNVPPTPVCDEFTVVSVTTNGTGKVEAETFDDGSHDNCGDVWFKTIKARDLCGTTHGFDGIFNSCAACDGLNGDDDSTRAGEQVYFDDDVFFCCEEIGEELTVILRVFDRDPGEGPVDPSRMMPGGDLFEHFNDCEVIASVEDELPPFLTCPPNLTLSCDFSYDLDSISRLDDRTFGTVVMSEADRQNIVVPGHGNPVYADNHVWGSDGLAADNCLFDLSIDVTTDISCGQGVVIRTFTATDSSGNENSCQQRIFFESFDPFGTSSIDWPADITVNNVCVADVIENPALTGEPDYGADVCSDVLMNYEDDIFFDDPEACVKIFRTWRVIDWCQYDDETGEGIFEDLQIIKVANTDGPEISMCEDLEICDSTATDCTTEIELMISATDDCTADENIEYSYAIDYFYEDDGDPTDFDADIPATPFATASEGGNDASGAHPFGQHIVRWFAEDGCGNVSVCDQLLDLRDCKAPSPKCFSGIVTVVMESVGEVTIWASDFDAGSDDNCGDVIASFSEDIDDTNRTFTCDDLGNQEVEVWFTDEAGNQSFCRTFLFIQDNSGACGGALGTVTGLVNTVADEPLAEAEVRLRLDNAGVLQDEMTGNAGDFTFNNIAHNQDYLVDVFKNDDANNGITALDLVRIQKHLLGLEPFETAYEYIAADVNNSESVSAGDLVQLRRLLLGYYSEFPNNTSWRFIDADQTFADQHHPWPLDEIIEIDNFSTETLDGIDFTAIKVGDMNSSAQTNGLVSTEDRSLRATFALDIEDRELKASERYRIPVYPSTSINLLGLQLSLVWDEEKMSFLGIEGGQLPIQEDNYVYDESENTIKMIWTDGRAVSAEEEEALFYIVVQAEEDGGLMSSIELSEKTMPGLIIDENEEVAQTTLRWDGQEKNSDWFISQNTPNPFSDQTVFSIYLPEEAELEWRCVDMDGKSAFAQRVMMDAGQQMIRIERDDLPHSGVWILELTARNGVGQTVYKDSRKMILLQ